ncbi:hypothetical protein WAI453_003843 [Rhynchosporium graminicola]
MSSDESRQLDIEAKVGNGQKKGGAELSCAAERRELGGGRWESGERAVDLSLAERIELNCDEARTLDSGSEMRTQHVGWVKRLRLADDDDKTQAGREKFLDAADWDWSIWNWRSVGVAEEQESNEAEMMTPYCSLTVGVCYSFQRYAIYTLSNGPRITM